MAVRGGGEPALLTDGDALSLLSLTPGRNMEDGQKSQVIRQTLNSLHSLEPEFERIAEERARQLLVDHRRIREASDARGLRYKVIPAVPVDKIGVYIFIPVASL